jgi:hypothetical protein
MLGGLAAGLDEHAGIIDALHGNNAYARADSSPSVGNQAPAGTLNSTPTSSRVPLVAYVANREKLFGMPESIGQ